LNELAPLTVEDVKADDATGIHFLNIREVVEQGRRLKTVGSARVIPVHHELVRIGLLRFADEIRSSAGPQGRLFPLLTSGPKGGFGEAWSKWFGRFKRGPRDHEQGERIPLVPARLQGCPATSACQRRCQRRADGPCQWQHRTFLWG
jgi:hypothetical protein